MCDLGLERVLAQAPHGVPHLHLGQEPRHVAEVTEYLLGLEIVLIFLKSSSFYLRLGHGSDGHGVGGGVFVIILLSLSVHCPL